MEPQVIENLEPFWRSMEVDAEELTTDVHVVFRSGERSTEKSTCRGLAVINCTVETPCSQNQETRAWRVAESDYSTIVTAAKKSGSKSLTMEVWLHRDVRLKYFHCFLTCFTRRQHVSFV